MKASLKRIYADRKIVSTEREEVYMDNRGLQVKVLTYAKAGSNPEKLTGKILYFYSR